MDVGKWTTFCRHNLFLATMLTIVVGQIGTLFKAPADAVNLDTNCDIANIDADHVAFSIHKFMVTAVEEYILDRLCLSKRTTVFVWKCTLPLMHELMPHATVVSQIDHCAVTRCLREAEDSFMRADGAWFPLCRSCLSRKKKLE